MLSPKKIARLKERLVRERDRVFNIHARLREDREDLVAPEVEFEENAQKDGLLEPMSEIDDSQDARLDAITDALKKIESGRYGRCERCGRQIEPKRLDALPWATLCSACQAEVERGPVRGLSEDVELPELPPDLQGLSDDEILRYVLDELQEYGRGRPRRIDHRVQSRDNSPGRFFTERSPAPDIVGDLSRQHWHRQPDGSHINRSIIVGNRRKDERKTRPRRRSARGLIQ